MWLTLLLACGAEPQPADTDLAALEVEALLALGYVDHAEFSAVSGESGVEILDADKVQPGRRLITHAADCEAELLTHDGNLLRRWHHSECAGWSNAELMPDGSLLVPMQRAFGEGADFKRQKKRYGQEFSLLWLEPGNTVRHHFDLRAHHDTEVQPNGEIWTTVTHRRRIEEVAERPVLDEDVVAITPQGEERWRFSLHDVLAASPELELRMLLPGHLHGSKLIDLLHINAIERMRPLAEGPIYARDNVLLTSRVQNAVMVVDVVKRTLVWAWGPGILQGPHDAHLLESGNLLIFDNGYRPRTSRVLEVDPRTERIVWRYHPEGEQAFFTHGRGSAQRLPNGNTLLADSNNGEAREVTPDGTIVWRYRNPRLTDGKRHAIVRVKHYD